MLRLVHVGYLNSTNLFFYRVLFVLTTCIFAGTAHSQSILSSSIAETVEPLIKGYQGDVAVAVYHFESDTHWSVRGDVVMPTASLIKLPVMIEAYRQVAAGKVKLDQRIEVKRARTHRHLVISSRL